MLTDEIENTPPSLDWPEKKRVSWERIGPKPSHSEKEREEVREWLNGRARKLNFIAFDASSYDEHRQVRLYSLLCGAGLSFVCSARTNREGLESIPFG